MAEERTPQVAFVSSLPDRSHIEPLVRGLRGHDIDVWWDGDSLLPGEDWERATWAVLQRVPVTGLVLSKASLASKNFQRAIDVVVLAKRHLIPIQIEEFDRSRGLPAEIANREWLRFLDSGDLERAVGAFLRTVRTVTSPTKTPPESKSATKSKAAPSTPAPSITLLLGDATSPDTWQLGSELLTLIEYSARLKKTLGDTRFSVSFTALLGALFYAGGTWSQWAFGFAQSSGFHTNELPPIPVTPATTTRPFRVTKSAASLLQSARQFAGRSNVLVNVQHLIAALIYEPAGHESDLDRYGFNRVGWANELIHVLESRSPADVAVFTELRDAAFPITKAPPPNAPSFESNAAPNFAENPAPAPESDLWTNADDSLKLVFSWAAALTLPVSMPSDGKVDIRQLLGGILRILHSSNEFWKMAGTVAPGLVANLNEPKWAAFYRKLGLPILSADTPPVLSDFPPHTLAVADVLDKARGLEKRLEPGSKSSASAGAILMALWEPTVSGGSAAIDPLLPDLGFDADAFLRLLLEGDGVSADETKVVQEILSMRTFRPWDRAHLDSDRVSGSIPPDQDLLDARKPALRFAKLLAAKDVQPPIALGLFGNWGSGKTFFMGLMRDRISSLAGSGGAYVGRVVQIEFNAWHYHDTNLWASLAMRIFEGLAIELGGKKDSDIEAMRKALHQKLRSSEARKSEADVRRTQALNRRATVAKELETKQAERIELEKKSVLLRLAAAWQVIKTDPVFADLRVSAASLKKHFGIDAAIESAEDLKRLRRDIDETSTHALGLFAAIGERFHGLGRGAMTASLLILVAASALALGKGFDKVAEYLKISLPQFSTTMLEVAALVSTAIAWCGKRVKEIRLTVDQIAKVDAALAAAEKTVLPIELQKLQTQISDLDKEIHQAGEELTAAEREIAEAIAEIDRINRGGLVYDFLQERRSAATYLGHLGLISTIRQDLDRLGELLKDFAAEGENPIERIVLYVDDLDRCHPDKVVEVLQAVHLLLAFDFFNVVVGVDARWLERSLRRQYVGRGTRANREDSFNPQDYLEKIFQIPYALSRIDEGGFKRLIGGLIETRSDQSRKAREEKEAAEKAASLKAAAEAARLAKEADPKQAPVVTGDMPNGETNAGDVPGVESNTENQKHLSDRSKDDPKPAKTAEPAMYFEDHEESFIQLLYTFIDRPRLAKRFVNIYRLLRVRADDEGEGMHFAAGPTSEEYSAALILLAIQVGHPIVAARVVEALTLELDGLTWPGLLNELAAGRVKGMESSRQERLEIAIVAAKVAGIGHRVPLQMTSYRRWAPRVACYSFDWHRSEPVNRPETAEANASDPAAI